ncbi:MAG: hypothetical protein AAFQ98_11450, partial [Bacteroidota bacterium]
MDTLNRRHWLKLSGLSALAAGMLPGQSLASKPAAGWSLAEDPDDEVRRLLFNENPDGPSEQVKQIITQVLPRASKYATFHTYDFQAPKALIAEQEGLEPENVLLGHGSFEPLVWVAQYFGGQGQQIIVPSPSFDVVGNFARK